MFFNSPRARAANDLVSALKRRQLIELKTSDAELTAEIEALLESYERRLSKPSAEVTAALAADIGTLLLESENVDEIFADNVELGRLVNAALMDYLDGIARRPPPASKRADAPPPQRTKTLAEQGLAFPLFEGPRESLVSDGEGPCAVCNAPSELRFNHACYACFRAGKALRRVGTELGAIDSEAAASGYALPIPATVVRPDWHVVPVERDLDGTEWVRCRIDRDAVQELLRTPAYSTWQGESWLFCCDRPMIFTGSPNPDRVDARTLGSMLDATMAEGEKRLAELADQAISVYAFRCAKCNKRRAHWDMD